MQKPGTADDTTIGPASFAPPAAPRYTLRRIFDGAARRAVADVYVLREGATELGRAVDSVRGVLVADPRASRLQATIRIEGGRAQLTNESARGTPVNGRPADVVDLGDGDIVRVGDSFYLWRLIPSDARDTPLRGVIGVSPAVMKLRASIAVCAPTAAGVLLLGETGAGKEVAARALHDASGRPGPFVAVNATAIPETLAESHLFGHVAGSFTGAVGDHPGVFRQADGGTLFLDEIGDFPVALQPKLLRVLDERRVTPVGGGAPIDVDVRVLAATNQDLDARMKDGRFRSDLYARLAEITIALPPLRERREDVLLLLASALDPRCPPLAPDLVEALLLHDWPFNVRELLKVATELAVRGGGAAELTRAHVSDRLRARALVESTPPRAARQPQRASAPPPTKEQLARLVVEHKGVVADIARATGRSRKQVYRWLRHHGLDVDAVREE